MNSGQEVIAWMNKAYEYAEQGKPESTFYAWEQAWKAAEPNEQNYLNTVERRPLLNQAYEVSARSCLHQAAGIREQELRESTNPAPFALHEARRNSRVHEWNVCIERAGDHALECNHRTLRRCIHEERTERPLKLFWRTRIKKFLLLTI